MQISPGCGFFPEDYQLDINAGEWANDGQWVFTQSMDGVFRIFDANNGEELSQFLMPKSSLSDFSLSPTGERLLKGNVGGSVVWDVVNGAELLNYRLIGFNVANYSPDGKHVLIGSNLGWLQIFPTWHSVEELIAYANDCCVIRELTPEERELFGLPAVRE